MMKTKVWMLAILFTGLFVVSCEEETPDVDEAKVLIEWLESSENPAGKHYVNTDLGEYTTAAQLHSLLSADKAFVIDIRKDVDYDGGHIEGAVNLTNDAVAGYIDTEDLSAYTDIVIACYSGQTAAWLTCLLNLQGYDNVSSLKFGMCSWHSDFSGSWNNNISSEKSTLFTADVTEKGPEGDLPSFNTGYDDAADIFAARIDVVIEEGFGEAAVTNADVYANLDDYYIVNYWSEADYLGMKHIDGAIQYTPKVDLATDAALKTLPADKMIAVYCYSGQTSANIAAYLRLIGYDAKSIKFGTNGMIYDDMTKSTWKASMSMDYEYVGM